MTKSERAAHCRKIAASGGRATHAKYGSNHMAQLGRKGQRVWVDRYFAGDVAAAHRWLGDMGAAVYARSVGSSKAAFAMPASPFGGAS